jgi:hypothetical protein
MLLEASSRATSVLRKKIRSPYGKPVVAEDGIFDDWLSEALPLLRADSRLFAGAQRRLAENVFYKMSHRLP